jgi:hypothetical protein
LFKNRNRYSLIHIYRVLTLKRKDVDPDSVNKNALYTDDFKVEIHFKDVCGVCKSTNTIAQLCKQCYQRMKDTEDLIFWQTIQSILD